MSTLPPVRHLLDEDYWIGKLAGIESRPLYRVASQETGACEIRRAFPAALTESLERAASGNPSGIYLLLLAALAVLLSRYTGADDPLLASTPFPPEEEVPAGLVYFRPRLVGDPSLVRLLASLARELEEVYNHLNFDFEGLCRRFRAAALGDERALFDVGLTYGRFNRRSPWLHDLDLWFGVERERGALCLRLRDGKGRRSRTYLDQLGRHFESTLRELLAHSDRPVRRIDLLGAEERSEILVGLNPGETAYPSEQSLVELFAEQAARDPGAPAVVGPERTLTYGELDRQAERLARELIDRHGVGPDDRVGVLLERSERLIVALLAILKAGGAYVPIDPEYPEERVELMLDDIADMGGMGGRLVLAEGELGARLAGRAAVLDMGAVLADIDVVQTGPAPARPPQATSRNLAYVMYTSGSTGRPKGVLVEQRSVTRLVRNTNYLELRPGDRILQTGSMSFDASTFEVWGALLNGATLHLAPREELLDASRLGRLIAGQGITCIWLTASLFNQVVDRDLSVFAPLRVLLIGGERLSLHHVNRVRREVPDVAIVNCYGPTENTTFTTCFPVRRAFDSDIPIGRPVSHTRVYVLDEEDRPVPIGVVGELCCGGDGLARGYLRQPERTAASFVPDPFRAGERMYRTGDLARWSEEGNLEYIGRRDAQVKVRGFRIEPGEIDCRLREHPAVREALTIAREVAGDRALVSYLVSAEPLAPEDLRLHLGRSLPGFMIPSHFILLDRLPLNSNGKVDLAALPEPGGAGSRSSRVAPRNLLEERLIALWEEILGVEGIGVDDSFFELGGHSLKAAAIVARARTELGLDVRLADLFESPTIAGLAGLAVVASAPSAPIPPIPPIPRAPRTPQNEDLPLSFAQQRMWFLDLWEPGGAAYNLPGSVGLDGPLHVPALAGALAEVGRRHEVLRTTFASVGGRPRQRIHPRMLPALPLVDLTGLAPLNRRREAARLAEREAREPFDLARGPLLRCRLLRLAEDEHAFLLTLHHIAADGGSVGVLIRELAALYAAAVAGEPSPLPELPIQYADYAAWQRRALEGGQAEPDLAYWRERLSDLPAVPLPADRRGPAVRSFRGGLLRTPLPQTLARGLAALGGHTGATLFMTVLAGFQALLARCSGQMDIAVGSPVAGRTHREIEPLIGLFVNTLVLRTDLAGDPSVAELVGRARQVTLQALAHQDLPFEMLVEHLAPERDAGRSPLFQVLFAHQDLSLSALALPGLRSRPLAVDLGTAKFDLTLYLEEAGGIPTLALEYDRERFDDVTVQRLGAQLERLLTGMTAAPERPLSALPLLGGAERQQLLREWNDTGSAPAAGACIHHLFEAQAERTPAARAIACAGESLTYAELDRRAGRLARRLRTLGVGPEVLVGLCVERTLEMAVGVLAILKAGGAYLPLDPAYPAARTSGMLEDSGARVLLTQERWRGRFAGRTDLLCVTVDGEPGSPDAGAGVELPAAGPRNLAYVIYTSGSTGRPKGVAIEHRSAAALVAWARGVYGPEDLSGVLAATSLCFDLSVFELFLPWSSGGTVLLAENALALPAVAARERVTLLNTVPSAAAALLRENVLPASLRTVNLAGEPLLAPLVAEIYRSASGVERVFDLYGPTEDTTYSTFALRRPGGPATIGRPIAGTRVFLLDPAFHPVPLGTPGELCLGGAGLARGYLNRPDATALQFVPDPSAAAPGERLYRTGDLARQRPDGSLELLGRADRQVKVRGFRIEPGEVEAALARHPGVEIAVVVARREATGDLRLVAYWVPAGRPSILDSRELRSFLKESLPDPMLPAVFVRLENLPLLPNGKVDRAALPAAPREPEGEAARSLRPSSPIAELLAGIWAEVLGLAWVGAEDNFFELGGHSLLATQVVSRVREALGVDLAVRALFESPTPAALAVRVEALLASGSMPLPPLVPQSGEPVLSFAQARLWFLDRLEPGGASYNIPTAMRLLGDLNLPALARALAEVVRRHETLRSTFPALAGRPRLVIREDDRPPLFQADLSGLPEAWREGEALRLAAAEARAPFDLGRGPLLRARLLRLGGTEHAVLLTLHHIVADGWSLGVLVGEIGALYEGITAAATSPLPDLPIQYADYAVWQRLALDGEALAAPLGYWRQQLAGIAALQLPTDRPRLPRRARRAGLLPVELPRRLSADLALLARRRGLTLFMTLLGGFQALLARYAGQNDVAVGSPVAGRTHREVEPLIGLFVNTLVLRTDLSGDPPASRLLERVREVALGAYGHQELPFEMLVEELAPERDTGRSPLFQVMLVLQNTPPPRLDLPGLALRPIEVGTGAAKFDLTLFLQEGSAGLTGELEFDRDLFEAATARRLLTHLETLLGEVVAAPETPLSGLPLLSAAERHQLLTEWEDTAMAGPPAAGFLDLFAAQVRRAPEAEAVVCEGERLSYRELAVRVDRLARVLAGMGVGPEVRVGICLEPSLDLVVGLLGILRAGGAYVPLDPAYPRERLDWMVEDSRVAVLLTRERMDAFTPAPADESGLRVQVAPENLAYVIYTSGSTGRPKGVMVSHGALAHYLRWCLLAYGLDRGTGAPLHSSIGFDLTVTSLFPPLLAGRTVTLVPERLGIEALGRTLDQPAAGAGFSLVKITPAHLELLNRQLPGAAKAGKAGVLILGGEALWAESLAAWRAEAPGTRLINEYGPTEATVGCCVYEVPVGGPAAGAVPIGRPIVDTRLYLLDRGLQPVPAGVPGELYIAGAGLARGYLDLPGQTAERFVPDPVGGEKGGRLYRSGDLARYLPDGCLEYLGRADHQMKIRGFRIEPGEIEAALVQHPGVREAIVVGRRGGPGDLRLVAYWVPRQEEAAGAPSPGELKRFLRERLPAHMVPAALVRLPALPLTAHGKVDRAALPAPDAARPELESAYTAPASPAERLIAEVWQRVLRLEKVGIDDNFFDAGGHSLLMVEVQAQLQELLVAEIDLVTLFEHATVRSLAAHLRGGDPAPALNHVHERAERQQRAAERKRLAQGARRLGT